MIYVFVKRIGKIENKIVAYLGRFVLYKNFYLKIVFHFNKYFTITKIKNLKTVIIA